MNSHFNSHLSPPSDGSETDHILEPFAAIKDGFKPVDLDVHVKTSVFTLIEIITDCFFY